MKRYAIMTSQQGCALESYDTVPEAIEKIKDYHENLLGNFGIKDNQDGSYTSFDEIKKAFPNIFNITDKQNFRNEVVFPNIFDAAVYSLTDDGTDKKYDLTDDGTGKKYDTGKSMVGTAFQIFANALLGIGACVEFGTHKYPKSDNWKLVDDGINRYTNSLLRHLAKHFSGQEKDTETGLPHLFHAGWNMLAIIEFYLMEHPDIVKEIQK